MDATDQVILGSRLDEALTAAGIVIESPETRFGNIKRWNRVPASTVIGRLLTLGWRVYADDVKPRGSLKLV